MKDWKGNSASVRSQLAIKADYTTKGREENDFYATDPKALLLLLNKCSNKLKDLLETAKESTHDCAFDIWECACGNGNLFEVLYNNAFDVLPTDIEYRGCKDIYFIQEDFLKHNGKYIDQYVAPIILTNPPYSLATEFIEHALEILPDGGLYIALMNITYLAGQKRFERVYSKGTLREVYIFSKRIECWKNNERPKDKCGSMANYAWYVFQKGYNGQPTLYWL